jgi:hypothetical protein
MVLLRICLKIDSNLFYGVLNMRVISKSEVSVNLLVERLEDAGFECSVEEENKVWVHGTGCNLRLQIDQKARALHMRGIMMLRPELSTMELNDLVIKANERLSLVKFLSHRWDDGKLGLWSSYTLFFPFDMNLSNVIFTMRRFIESVNTLKAMEDLSDRWVQSQRPIGFVEALTA